MAIRGHHVAVKAARAAIAQEEMEMKRDVEQDWLYTGLTAGAAFGSVFSPLKKWSDRKFGETDGLFKLWKDKRNQEPEPDVVVPPYKISDEDKKQTDLESSIYKPSGEISVKDTVTDIDPVVAKKSFDSEQQKLDADLKSGKITNKEWEDGQRKLAEQYKVKPTVTPADPFPKDREILDGAGEAVRTLMHHEQFSSTTYWDMTAHRGGYGSDTISYQDEAGVWQTRPVVEGDEFTKEGSAYNLRKRIEEEFLPRIFSQGGKETKLSKEEFQKKFEEMHPVIQGEIISQVYNYGHIKGPIAKAIVDKDYIAMAKYTSEVMGSHGPYRDASGKLVSREAARAATLGGAPPPSDWVPANQKRRQSEADKILLYANAPYLPKGKTWGLGYSPPNLELGPANMWQQGMRVMSSMWHDPEGTKEEIRRVEFDKNAMKNYKFMAKNNVGASGFINLKMKLAQNSANWMVDQLDWMDAKIEENNFGGLNPTNYIGPTAKKAGQAVKTAFNQILESSNPGNLLDGEITVEDISGIMANMGRGDGKPFGYNIRKDMYQTVIQDSPLFSQTQTDSLGTTSSPVAKNNTIKVQARYAGLVEEMIREGTTSKEMINDAIKNAQATDDAAEERGYNRMYPEYEGTDLVEIEIPEFTNLEQRQFVQQWKESK